MDRKGGEIAMQQLFLIPTGEVDIDMLKETIPPINKFLSDNVNAHISKIIPFATDFNLVIIEF